MVACCWALRCLSRLVVLRHTKERENATESNVFICLTACGRKQQQQEQQTISERDFPSSNLRLACVRSSSFTFLSDDGTCCCSCCHTVKDARHQWELSANPKMSAALNIRRTADYKQENGWTFAACFWAETPPLSPPDLHVIIFISLCSNTFLKGKKIDLHRIAGVRKIVETVMLIVMLLFGFFQVFT